MDLRYRLGDSEQMMPLIRVEREGEQLRVTLAERSYPVQSYQTREGLLTLILDGHPLLVAFARDERRLYLHLNGQTVQLERVDTQRRARRTAGQGGLKASMPGQVVAVLVKPGDQVTRGQALVLLEAMKMEMRVTAPQAGTIQAVRCEAGQVVERDQVLVEFQAAKTGDPDA